MDHEFMEGIFKMIERAIEKIKSDKHCGNRRKEKYISKFRILRDKLTDEGPLIFVYYEVKDILNSFEDGKMRRLRIRLNTLDLL